MCLGVYEWLFDGLVVWGMLLIFESGDVSFNYDSAFDIVFEGSDDIDDFVEEDTDDMLDYDHDPQGTSKKHKHKGNLMRVKMTVRNWKVDVKK